MGFIDEKVAAAIEKEPRLEKRLAAALATIVPLAEAAHQKQSELARSTDVMAYQEWYGRFDALNDVRNILLDHGIDLYGNLEE